MKREFIFIIVLLSLKLLSYNCAYSANRLSPLDFGINEAKSGIERYWAIYKTHITAKEKDAIVDYKGIRVIDIEIPKDAVPIPLSSKTFFRGVELRVLNNGKDFFLFEMSQPDRVVHINKEDIDKGDFRINEELRIGDYLLFLEDETPWVKQRKGYNYGHARKDILLVHNGIAKNTPISNYNNQDTKVRASYCSINTSQKLINGLNFYRLSGSTKNTKLLSLKNVYNVIICDIEIHTPQSEIFGDYAIRLDNCSKVYFSDITIDGTYSAKDNYGYGVSMNNVYDVTFKRLRGKAEWGVFGNNNVNKVTLINCDLNRFDIHCYGKDIYMKKCVFRDLYNQFSSIKGEVVFDRCEFHDFIPFLFEYSYDAYTSFDLYFKNCTVFATSKKNYLIDARSLVEGESSERSELKVRHFPNLKIKGLTIIVEDYSSQYYSYRVGKKMIEWDSGLIPGNNTIKMINVKIRR